MELGIIGGGTSKLVGIIGGGTDKSGVEKCLRLYSLLSAVMTYYKLIQLDQQYNFVRH